METVRLSRKDFTKRFGDSKGITILHAGEEPVVYIPGRTSSRSMLHEIYHATESPDIPSINEGKVNFSPDEIAIEELRAEEFANLKRGKENGLPLSSFRVVVNVMLSYGCKPSVIMGSIKKALRKMGYGDLDRDSQSTIWWYVKRNYEQEKESGTFGNFWGGVT